VIAATASLIQSDSAVADQLSRLVTTQVVVAVALVIVALAALGVALGALLGVRKLSGTLDRALTQLNPRLDPLLKSATRIADDAEDVASSVKGRVTDVLATIDDLNGRLKAGAQAVEDRMKKFGAVVNVVQSETEDLLLDAASTAHGVHAAAEVLRAGKPERIAEKTGTDDSDVFTD
jgi:uncharacterized protein YoxC